jgi:dTDP-N-acetylfucosamine:lipid II N-acetylfucosaminyltransferase
LKYLHIIPNDKFAIPFINLINENFKKNEHLFITGGSINYAELTIEKNNVQSVSVDLRSILRMLIKMYTCEKIILHSLLDYKIVILLFFQPWLLNKSNWVIWGGDLYYYLYRKKNLKSNMYEQIRKIVIKQLGGFITHIKGDYELAKKWYGAKGSYYYSFMYPSNLYNEDLSKDRIATKKIFIQVGNSADPSNQHIEILEKLLMFSDKEFEIICPLSYGDLNNHASEVIKKGRELFGDKFNPITEFIPFSKYLEILAKVDVAVFNHNRQQAVGNITTLLGLGKKVYINDNVTTWDFCKKHKLEVFSVNKDIKNLFEKMEEDTKNNNIKHIQNNFSKEKLINDLNFIFESRK